MAPAVSHNDRPGGDVTSAAQGEEDQTMSLGWIIVFAIYGAWCLLFALVWFFQHRKQKREALAASRPLNYYWINLKSFYISTGIALVALLVTGKIRNLPSKGWDAIDDIACLQPRWQTTRMAGYPGHHHHRHHYPNISKPMPQAVTYSRPQPPPRVRTR